MANKKISELTRLSANNITDNDWMVVVNGTGTSLETKRVSVGDLLNGYGIISKIQHGGNTLYVDPTLNQVAINGLPWNSTTAFTIHGDTIIDGTVTATGKIIAQGNVIIGDAETDKIIFTADIYSDITPGSADAYSIGSDTKYWKEFYGKNIYAKGDLSVLGNSFLRGSATVSRNFSCNTDVFVDTTNHYARISSLRIGDNYVDPGSKNLFVEGDVNIDGGDLTTTLSTFNVFNTNATTINAFGAASDIQIGSASGTTNINNNLDVDGDVNIDGGDLTVSTGTFNLANSTATTINAFGAATLINFGAESGVTNVKNDLNVSGDFTTDQPIFNILNDTAYTVNAFGEATAINIGSTSGITDVKNTLNITNGDLTTTASTFNIVNTNATSVNAFAAATNIQIGGLSGKTTIRNANTNITGTLTVYENIDVKGDVTVENTHINTNSSTFNVFNTNATTINAFGAASDIQIGSASGITRIKNNLDVDGDVNIDGGDLTVSTGTFNLANSTATTINAFGAATLINFGSTSGTTTINNNAIVGKDLTVNGNLAVKGTTTTIDSTIVAIQDSDFVLRKSANTAGNGGIIITAGSGPGLDRTFQWNYSTDKWELDSNVNIAGDLNIAGGDLTVSTASFNLANSATTISIGATTGKTTIRNANTVISGALTTSKKSKFYANVEFDSRISVAQPALFSSNVTVLGVFTMNEDVRTLANVETSGTFVTATGNSNEWEEAYGAITKIKNTGADVKFLIGTPDGYKGAIIDNSKNSGIQVSWHPDTSVLEFDAVVETAYVAQNMSLGDYWFVYDNEVVPNSGLTLSTNNTLAVCPSGHGRTVHGIGSIASGATHVTNTAISIWGNEYVNKDLTVDGDFKTNLSTFSFLEGTDNIVIGKTGGSITIKGNLTVQGNTQQSVSADLIVISPTISLGGNTAPISDDDKDRGVEFRWHAGHTGGSDKLGFFGFDDSTGKFTFIPDSTKNSNTGVFSGTTGIIDAKVDWSNVLNNPNFWTGFTDGTNTAWPDVQTGDTFTFVAGNAMTVAVNAGADSVTYSHADTSSVADLLGATNTFITAQTFDTYGHVQSRTTGTVDFTVAANYAFANFAIAPDSGFTWGDANTNSTQSADSSSDTLTLVTGGGIDLYSSTNGSDAIKIGHKDTSTQANITATAGKFINALNFDTYGHVTSATTTTETTYDHLAVNTTGGALIRLHSSAGATDDVKIASGNNVTVAYTNNDTITINSSYVNTTYSVSTETGSNSYNKVIRLSGSDSSTDDVTLAVGPVNTTYGLTIEESGDTITFKHADTSTQSSVDNTTENTYIKSVSLDEYGHISSLSSGTVVGYSTNTADKLVKRDSSGNFSAGTITAALNGNASSATYASAVTLTNDESTNATNYPLFVNATTGNLSPRTDTGFTYNPYSGGLSVSGTFSESSDERLKTNIQKIEGAVDIVKQLSGYTFNKKGSDEKLTGVIAQEVQKALPEAVEQGPDDYLHVRYGNLVGVLIEAIKEQQKEIDSLKEIINNKNKKGNTKS